ncbi:hypothetical protein MC7420_2948 [Coleofasciculus chthonoplastes PCC 7420]|uniref:Uncharacterized protein n=1 Tax=Coleofasciculus chthonoplastes PCC 7420 TaxID=118168 RepID=B4VJQ8_9CYAN|nr:hypothetical protein [Coleofasciculus chthonoplastes]EDX77624.1 hypothetical protein MC7420_2948 [Coleofasciculus chthonoplastes PCC 7420]
MNKEHILICQAFGQMLENSTTELEEKLTTNTRVAIARYFTQLPEEDRLNPSIMAIKIGHFCYSPGHENLKKWLLRIYNRLGIDDIQKVVKKTGDPGEEADAPTETNRILINEARDICQYLQNWATQQLNQTNQRNNPPVQGQSKPGNQNAAN